MDLCRYCSNPLNLRVHCERDAFQVIIVTNSMDCPQRRFLAEEEKTA